MLRYLLAWIPMLFIAVANGALREGGYGPLMSEPRAHQLSTLIGMLLFAVYIRFVVRRWRPVSGRQAMAVGLAWLALTVAFEFLFGHYVAGHDWSRLLADYDLLAGRLWIALLIWIALAPYLFYRLSDAGAGLRTPPPPPPDRRG